MSEMLPLFPLSTVLFPGMRLPLHLFEERYRRLARDLREGPEPRMFGVLAIRRGRETGADSIKGIESLHEVGCVAAVRHLTEREDGRFDLQTVGTERFRLLSLDRSLPYLRGEIERLPDEPPGQAAESGQKGEPGQKGELDQKSEPSQAAGPGQESEPGQPASARIDPVVARVQASFRAYLNALADRGGGVISVADLPDEPLLLSYVVAAAMIIDLPDRQNLLAAPDAAARLKAERGLLARESAILRATTSRPAPDFKYEPYSKN